MKKGNKGMGIAIVFIIVVILIIFISINSINNRTTPNNNRPIHELWDTNKLNSL
ncbi:hypothetical protein [Alkaliphilus sp. B6464]|uniref:hypothetical protein n=1 Tax=Alkaliphilus sp. B6464 TaxID=2731219 RepID=UPI001BA7A701|nr:hypothetical protein [Alkaliphilus sp. B6464]QUH20342.1 hypothetical protein HYG84_10815 [Alkaliphilus sp. B6464]